MRSEGREEERNLAFAFFLFLFLWGCTGKEHKIFRFDYHLDVSLAANCGDEDISADASDVQMLNLTLTPLKNENIRLEKLTVHFSGSGEDYVDIEKLKLYHDSNGNSIYDVGSDILLG
ncbi:MAG: hypothetical protein N2234_10510, partial [Planctomycetota bacterium]|nr:hypothetical protein [Planctomycetota bacterium]